jgi:DNA-binding PadR family transcriptional regulator
LRPATSAFHDAALTTRFRVRTEPPEGTNYVTNRIYIENDMELNAASCQILLALADRDLHGYGIMADVLERTDGRMRLWPGILYGSLKKLADAGLVEETDPPRDAPRDRMARRFYRLTRDGRRALGREMARLARDVETARSRKIAVRD